MAIVLLTTFKHGINTPNLIQQIVGTDGIIPLIVVLRWIPHKANNTTQCFGHRAFVGRRGRSKVLADGLHASQVLKNTIQEACVSEVDKAARGPRGVVLGYPILRGECGSALLLLAHFLFLHALAFRSGFACFLRALLGHSRLRRATRERPQRQATHRVVRLRAWQCGKHWRGSTRQAVRYFDGQGRRRRNTGGNVHDRPSLK